MQKIQALSGGAGTIIIYADLGIGLAMLLSVFFKSIILIVTFAFAGGALLLVQGGLMLLAMRQERIAGNTTDSETGAAQEVGAGIKVLYEDAQGNRVQAPQKPPQTTPKVTPLDYAAAIIKCATCGTVMQKHRLRKGGWQLLCTNCGRDVTVDTDNRHTIQNAGDESKKPLNKMLNRIGEGASSVKLVDMDHAGGTPTLSDRDK